MEVMHFTAETARRMEVWRNCSGSRLGYAHLLVVLGEGDEAEPVALFVARAAHKVGYLWMVDNQYARTARGRFRRCRLGISFAC